MKIITHNAAIALFRATDEFRYRPEGWKCIYVKLPGEKLRRKYSLPVLDKTVLEYLLSRVKGAAYLLDGGELFILTQSPHRTFIARLSMYLWTLFPEEKEVRSHHQLYSIIDVAKEWAGLSAMCEKRYIMALAASEFQAPFAGYEEPEVPVEIMAQEHVAGYLQE